MADPRAFMSFDFDHDEYQRTLFAGQAKNSKTPFTIEALVLGRGTGPK